MIEIRRVSVEEWAELRALRLTALRDSPDAFWTRYDEAVARSDDDWRAWASLPCHVAVSEGRLVGMVAGLPHGSDPAVAELIALFVAAAARGRGIGAQLVAAQVAWARREGFARLDLMVNVENDEARRLYSSLGFRDTGRREPLRDGAGHLAVLTRELELPGPEPARTTPV